MDFAEYPKALHKPGNPEDGVTVDDAKAEAAANKAGYWFLGKAPAKKAGKAD